MKISKKLAKEILVGNFENVDLDTLQKCSRARTNKFEYIKDLESSYQKAGVTLRKKDLENLDCMELVYLPNESYSRWSKGVLLTDVLILTKWKKGYILYINREPSTNHKKYINLKVSKELKKEIIAREIEKLGFTIKGGN